MLVGNIDVDIFGDAHDAGLGGSVRNAGKTDHIHLDGKVYGSCKIRKKIERAFNDSDNDELFAFEIFGYLTAEFFYPGLNGFFAVYDAFSLKFFFKISQLSILRGFVGETAEHLQTVNQFVEVFLIDDADICAGIKLSYKAHLLILLGYITLVHRSEL